MKKTRKVSFFTGLILLIGSMVFASGAKDDFSRMKAPVKGSADTDMSAAEIYSMYPLNVLPGTLVSISGDGFGDTAGIIYIDGIGIDEFYGWDNNTIWVKVPETESSEMEVQAGMSVAEDLLYRAPEGSITVRWVVDADALQAVADATFDKYKLDFAPMWKFPLHIKGEWVKSGDGFGNKSGSWDGGSRRLMWNQPETGLWISEVVFTPENMESYKPGVMKFAFEDSEDEARNIATFESDMAFILKKEWAKADPFTDISSDPAVRVGTTSRFYNERNNTIQISYPVAESK
ncbi:MAG: hypothetical protein JXR86_16375 [Spirochaetales bacterium]|nr:hypothetical protein [Spirochaetales bacterium]